MKTSIEKEYLDKGYIIRPIKHIDKLNFIRELICKIISNKINVKFTNSMLDTFHHHIDNKDLNNIRIEIFKELNKEKLFKKYYYEIFEDFLDKLVGNEIVMQKNINLSIQIPKDKSSVLPMHADVWDGNSAFETVCWLPLVNVFKSKAMFILPNKKNIKYQNQMMKSKNLNSFFNKIKKDLIWVKVNYGELLMFNQNLIHGNIVNSTKETRFSFNCRFKSFFSPYGDKTFGSFFEPVKLKPVTRFGLNYKLPKI